MGEKWKWLSFRVSLTLCDPMGYTGHGILRARILEWVSFPSSRGSSQPRDPTQVSRIAGRRFTIWATREAPMLTEAGNKKGKRTGETVIVNVFGKDPKRVHSMWAPWELRLPCILIHCSFRLVNWTGSSGGVESDAEHGLWPAVWHVSVYAF